jgi:hypothetical protein
MAGQIRSIFLFLTVTKIGIWCGCGLVPSLGAIKIVGPSKVFDLATGIYINVTTNQITRNLVDVGFLVTPRTKSIFPDASFVGRMVENYTKPTISESQPSVCLNPVNVIGYFT